MSLKNVIIVEDERLTARYIEGIVTDLGIDVLGIHDNANDLLSALESELPSLILMDINIKGHMDGIRLAHLINQNHNIPIIFLTAYSDSDTLEEAVSISPYGFVSKPFTEKELEIALKVAYKRFSTSNLEHLSAPKLIQLSTNYSYDTERTELYIKGELHLLNAKMQKLLALLVKHHDHVVPQEEIEKEVWNDEPLADSSLRTLVYSLRKSAPELNIKTQSKFGYILHTLAKVEI